MYTTACAVLNGAVSTDLSWPRAENEKKIWSDEMKAR